MFVWNDDPMKRVGMNEILFFLKSKFGSDLNDVLMNVMEYEWLTRMVIEEMKELQWELSQECVQIVLNEKKFSVMKWLVKNEVIESGWKKFLVGVIDDYGEYYPFVIVGNEWTSELVNEELLESWKNMKMEVENGDHLIHLAAKRDDLLIVEFLVEECEVDVNVRDCDGYGPIWCALMHGSEKVSQYLVKRDDVLLEWDEV